MTYRPNPILNPYTFVPDVEAHVWADGRIYLYGSLDIEGCMQYCSREYHVYSSDDMIHWVDHGVSFRLDDVEWAKTGGGIYAPDCAYRDGKYYLYYCIVDGRCGVAVSDCPYGPFKDVGPIEHVTMIDPAVLIDDDGQAYLYWGQFDGVRVAKLKENMVEIDPETITQPLSVAEHEFHEGSSVKKINGKYYFVYTDTHRHGNKATSMGYAVSDNPMSGFVYQGVIVDNFGCDPKTWNNHGSIACFNGQWYVFYHRSTHGCEFSRHVCIEPITIDENGKIAEVKMTTSGRESALPAGDVMPAFRACEMSGNVRIAGDKTSPHGFALTQIQPNDTATFRYLDFDGENTFTVTLQAEQDVRVELYVDGTYHACLTAAANTAYASHSTAIAPISGKHTVELKFFGDFSAAKVSEFIFAKA